MSVFSDDLQNALEQHFGAETVELYKRTVMLLIEADASGISASGIADTAASVGKKLDASEISEMRNLRVIKRQWSRDRLRLRCETICSVLTLRGFFPRDILPTVRDAHTMAVRHHAEFVDASIEKSTVSAAQHLLAAGILAQGAMTVSDQGIRFSANQLNANQRFFESRFYTLGDLTPEVKLALEAQTKKLIEEGMKMVSKSDIPEKHYCEHRIPGYGGWALIQLGCHQRNKQVTMAGVTHLKQALSIPHGFNPGEHPSFHWDNAFRAVGLLRTTYMDLADDFIMFLKNLLLESEESYRLVACHAARRFDYPTLSSWIGSEFAQSVTAMQSACVIEKRSVLVGALMAMVLLASTFSRVLSSFDSGTHTVAAIPHDSGTHTVASISFDSGTHTATGVSFDSGTHTVAAIPFDSGTHT